MFVGHFRGKAKLADFEGSSFPLTTYGANIELAHRFIQEKHSFIPAVGLQYSGFKQNAYQDESVTIVQYSARRGQVFDGILSVKYACNLEKESVKIIPSVKLGVVRNLTLKADNIKYSIDGYNNDAAITIPISRQKQTTFFALPSLSFSWPGAEVCVFYRLDKANKSFANTVSAKIAANF